MSREKQNVYFDNNKVEEMILKLKRKNYKDYKLLNEIMKELDKIVIAIINKYHFYNFEDYDELFQQGRLVCLEGLRKYDPSKVIQKNKSVFSYFSCAIKKNLRFFTYKKTKSNKMLISENNIEEENSSYKDIIINHQITDEKYIEQMQNYIEKKHNIELLFEILKDLFREKSADNRKTKIKKRRMYSLVIILKKYIDLFKEFSMKKFIEFAKSYGYTPEYVKKFFLFLRKKENKQFIKQNFF